MGKGSNWLALKERHNDTMRISTVIFGFLPVKGVAQLTPASSRIYPMDSNCLINAEPRKVVANLFRTSTLVFLMHFLGLVFLRLITRRTRSFLILPQTNQQLPHSLLPTSSRSAS